MSINHSQLAGTISLSSQFKLFPSQLYLACWHNSFCPVSSSLSSTVRNLPAHFSGKFHFFIIFLQSEIICSHPVSDRLLESFNMPFSLASVTNSLFLLLLLFPAAISGLVRAPSVGKFSSGYKCLQQEDDTEVEGVSML